MIVKVPKRRKTLLRARFINRLKHREGSVLLAAGLLPCNNVSNNSFRTAFRRKLFLYHMIRIKSVYGELDKYRT